MNGSDARGLSLKREGNETSPTDHDLQPNSVLRRYFDPSWAEDPFPESKVHGLNWITGLAQVRVRAFVGG